MDYVQNKVDVRPGPLKPNLKKVYDELCKFKSTFNDFDDLFTSEEKDTFNKLLEMIKKRN
jgi:hypothetical protein